MGSRRVDVRLIALVAVMVAMTCILTWQVKVPVLPTRGYIHLGDVAATFSALAFGPWLGFIIAGGGTALGDLVGGYTLWAPWSFIIHGLQGFLAGYMARLGRHRPGAMLLGAFLGEVVVVLGYFLVEIPLYGKNAALFELPLNCVQGAFGLLGMPLLYLVARAYPAVLEYGRGRVEHHSNH